MIEKIKKLENFLGNHVLILMVISLVLGSIITIIMPNKLLEKELTCILNYSQYLVRKTSDDPNIELLYMGKKVEEPYVMSFTIENTGDYPIDNTDFKDKFSIVFDDSVKVLNGNINKTSNKYVLSEVLENSNIEKNRFIISNFMLNLNESFTLNIILDKKPNSIKYDYRVIGINKIKIRDVKQEKFNEFKNFIYFMLFCIFIIIGYIYYSLIKSKRIDKEEFEKYLKENNRVD